MARGKCRCRRTALTDRSPSPVARRPQRRSPSVEPAVRLLRGSRGDLAATGNDDYEGTAYMQAAAADRAERERQRERDEEKRRMQIEMRKREQELLERIKEQQRELEAVKQEKSKVSETHNRYINFGVCSTSLAESMTESSCWHARTS